MSFTISRRLLSFTSIESVMPSNHLILWCPFLLLLLIFPVSRSPVSQLFTLSGQSIGTSASELVFPKNFQSSFPLGLTGLIALQSKGLSSLFSSTTHSKASIPWCLAFFMVQFSHPYIFTGKNHSFDHTELCGQSDVSAF